MTETFEAYLTSQGNFTEEELRLIRSRAIIRKLRRKQLILKEGEISQHKIFVVKGLLKTYQLKDDGTEHILRFSPERSWTADAQSYTHQTPTRYNIEALENSEVMLWSAHDLHELFNDVPAFKDYSNKLMADTLYASHDRILMNISYTSEEKYQDFITSYPDVFRRVPLHMVASYLGVSRETLSRIRHIQLKQQKSHREE